jgi:hypothetical protein
LRTSRTTVTPSRANPIEVARPMPDAAPVTSATRLSIVAICLIIPAFDGPSSAHFCSLQDNGRSLGLLDGFAGSQQVSTRGGESRPEIHGRYHRPLIIAPVSPS